MFRNNVSVYCKNEEIAKQVRAYAQELNVQAGGRAMVSAEDKGKHTLQPATNMGNFEEIPEILRDIMQGGVFPDPQDLTRDERYIIYDTKINNYLNLYRISKRPELVEQIKDRLCELRG